MMTFTSSADLCRLPHTDPAQPVIAKLAVELFSKPLDTDPVTVALMQPHDADNALTELCNKEDVILEGIIEQAGVFLVVLKTSYQYGIVLVIPDENWISDNLRRCIKQNLYN